MSIDTGSIFTGTEDQKSDTPTITGGTTIPDISVSITKSEIFSDVSTGNIASSS